MKKQSSLLDYSYPFLDPSVWNKELKLYPHQKDFILRLTDKMYSTYNLKNPEKWVEDVTIIGSLTTTKFLTDSDLDVHVLVNIPAFIETNMPGASTEEAIDHLDTVRKQFDQAKILLPTTVHPCEFYFESTALNPSNTELVGRYSLYRDVWLKEPVMFSADLDYEESKRNVVNEAEDLAEELDGSFGKIRHDIQRIDELYAVITAWGQDKQKLFYSKIEKKLNDIEEEIRKDIKFKQDIVDERHEKQDPLGNNEIKFKYLARYGYFAVLQDLKELLQFTDGKVTENELPIINKIVNEASMQDSKKLLVDFDRTLAMEHSDGSIGEPVVSSKEALEKLKNAGYEIEIYSVRANDEKGLDEVKEWLDRNQIHYDSIFQGEKPRGTIIDDHAIQFKNNWNDIVDQVEKSDKKACLITAKLSQKYWIDPNGKEYAFNDLDHGSWIEQNRKLLEKYGFEYPNEYWLKSQGWLEIADNMLRHNWTRITTESDYDFTIEVRDINNLPPYLDDFVAQHYTGGGIEIDDLQGNYRDLEDPFPSLRKQINKTKMLRQQPVAKVFSKKEITAQTKKVKQGEYGAIMAVVPHDVAQEIVEWGVRNIKDSDVFSDEENPRLGRELEPHITVKYGLLTEDIKSVRQFFNDEKPFKAKLGKIRHFEPPEMSFDVVTIEVISEDFKRMNNNVTGHFECAEGLVSDEYHPHITVSYVRRGKGKDYIGSSEFEGKEILLDTLIVSPSKGNRTYFSLSNDKESMFILEKMDKQAAFYPSLVQPADNDWQFANGGDDVEIALQPDPVSDEETFYAPCTVGKPRSKEVWRQFMSIFKNPFSKKEEMTVDSAYDKDLEEAEQKELGGETLLEYSKGFYDPKKHDFPRNTTCDSLVQDMEPSKPLPVTYSPEMNPEFDKQNSPGGYPNRFCRKPESEWFSNEGEVNEALIQMLKNKEACIDSITRDITAFLGNGYWIDPAGKVFEVRGSNFGNNNTHDMWIEDNLKMLKKDYGITPFKTKYGPRLNAPNLVDKGWIRIGDSYVASSVGVTVKDLNNIPSSVDNLLAQFARNGNEIEIADLKNQYVEIEWPVKSVQQAVNRARMARASLNKQAGNQSASVPDYLCDEWKTEQINDDTDEEPYINHDQRDYPYGMHDSPENTGNNIGWPKDENRYVVLLDQLQNPADRNFPPGLMDYEVINYYLAAPMSDGIESSNPD